MDSIKIHGSLKFINNKTIILREKKIIIISVQVETFGLRSLTLHVIYRLFFAVFIYVYISIYYIHTHSHTQRHIYHPQQTMPLCLIPTP